MRSVEAGFRPKASETCLPAPTNLHLGESQVSSGISLVLTLSINGGRETLPAISQRPGQTLQLRERRARVHRPTRARCFGHFELADLALELVAQIPPHSLRVLAPEQYPKTSGAGFGPGAPLVVDAAEPR